MSWRVNVCDRCSKKYQGLYCTDAECIKLDDTYIIRVKKICPMCIMHIGNLSPKIIKICPFHAKRGGNDVYTISKNPKW